MSNITPYIFKCENCGAYKVFSPKNQALLCRHCGTLSQIEINRNVFKKPISQGDDIDAAGQAQTDEIEVLMCSSCGAALSMLKGEISGSCPFCGTGNVVPKENIKGLKPDECVPFTIEPQDAEKSFNNWIRRKWFVPNRLKKEAKAGNIKGVYSPCYSFDTSSRSSYRGVLGKRYTTYVGSGKNRRAVVKVKYFPISGNLDKEFYDVMAECSPHFDQRTLDRIRPFTLAKRAVYEKSFLSGFSADTANVSLSQGWLVAKSAIDSQIKSAILSRYSYDIIQSLDISTAYDDLKYSYMLVPVYLSSYKFKDKIYSFFVNGNTGKTAGKVPRSPIKILLAILGAVAVCVGAYLLYNYFSV